LDNARLISMRADWWTSPDFRAVPFDLQEVLRRRYREMADREMCNSAASARCLHLRRIASATWSLPPSAQSVRFFDEAAPDLRRAIAQSARAARCLAEGGLLLEAIERYENTARWLEAANFTSGLAIIPRPQRDPTRRE